MLVVPAVLIGTTVIIANLVNRRRNLPHYDEADKNRKKQSGGEDIGEDVVELASFAKSKIRSNDSDFDV